MSCRVSPGAKKYIESKKKIYSFACKKKVPLTCGKTINRLLPNGRVVTLLVGETEKCGRVSGILKNNKPKAYSNKCKKMVTIPEPKVIKRKLPNGNTLTIIKGQTKNCGYVSAIIENKKVTRKRK